jgi:WD40 repeat protein
MLLSSSENQLDIFPNQHQQGDRNDNAVRVADFIMYISVLICESYFYMGKARRVCCLESFITVTCVVRLWSLLTLTLNVFHFVLGNSYNSEERIVCSGYDNGDIKMFDLKTMSLRWETNVKNGVSIHPQYSCWFYS